MLNKGQLRALWQAADFKPNKRRGQHFLVDGNIRKKIVERVELLPTDTVFEIGAGFLELTCDLAERAKRVVAVEVDTRIATIVHERLQLPENVCFTRGDVLESDLETVAREGKIVVYGNLPYYITSPIIEKLLESAHLVKQIYCVMQKELAHRIVAKPGDRERGRLSLFVQYYTDVRVLFAIKKGSFYPVPKVDSALVRFDVLDRRKVPVSDETAFFQIIKGAYAQRRKAIVNSLSSVAGGKENAVAMIGLSGLDPLMRAEDLSLSDFARLSDIFTREFDKRM